MSSDCATPLVSAQGVPAFPSQSHPSLTDIQCGGAGMILVSCEEPGTLGGERTPWGHQPGRKGQEGEFSLSYFKFFLTSVSVSWNQGGAQVGLGEKSGVQHGGASY